jgi:uncharacterized protein
MKCPTCSVDLVMTDRQGVEIDYCPKCRGVWLDRGELDKITERAMAAEAVPAQSAPPRDYRGYPQRYEGGEGGEGGEGRYYHGRRRRSFLSDIFDFD